MRDPSVAFRDGSLIVCSFILTGRRRGSESSPPVCCRGVELRCLPAENTERGGKEERQNKGITKMDLHTSSDFGCRCISRGIRSIGLQYG